MEFCNKRTFIVFVFDSQRRVEFDMSIRYADGFEDIRF